MSPIQGMMATEEYKTGWEAAEEFVQSVAASNDPHVIPQYQTMANVLKKMAGNDWKENAKLLGFSHYMIVNIGGRKIDEHGIPIEEYGFKTDDFGNKHTIQ